MDKILVAGDLDNVANITVVDKKFILITCHDGRTVEYLYNPHFDKPPSGKTAYEEGQHGNHRTS